MVGCRTGAAIIAAHRVKIEPVDPRFTLALTKASIEAAEFVRDHGEADAAGPCIEVFGPFLPWLGLVGVAVDHLDGSGNEDFPGIAGIEERVTDAEGDFRLIDFNDPFERLPVRIDHRSPQLLCQQPGRPVGEAELILQLPRRHAVGMCRHQMRGPEGYFALAIE
jgi:hypothetical protein